MSEYNPNEAVGVWTAMCPQTTRDAHTKGRITTLIDLSKEGDERAAEQLLIEHTPTIEMLAKDMCIFNNSDADLKKATEAGKEAFRYALAKYDNKTVFEAHMKVYVIYGISQSLAHDKKI